MKNQKPFLSTIVIAIALLFAIAVTATGTVTSKMIEVFYGVSIYVDDSLLDARDANGKPVEAFIYNGTTYLPVRAISEAVGKGVQWDGKTRTVYLGKHNGEKPAVWLKDMDAFHKEGTVTFTESEQDNTGKTYQHTVRAASGKNTYLLNGQYSKITGTIGILQESREASSGAYAPLRIYGDDELLYETVVRGGELPQEFSVDLTGVLQMRVEFDGYWEGQTVADIYLAFLGDVGLWY